MAVLIINASLQLIVTFDWLKVSVEFMFIKSVIVVVLVICLLCLLVIGSNSDTK